MCASGELVCKAKGSILYCPHALEFLQPPCWQVEGGTGRSGELGGRDAHLLPAFDRPDWDQRGPGSVSGRWEARAGPAILPWSRPFSSGRSPTGARTVEPWGLLPSVAPPPDPPLSPESVCFSLRSGEGTCRLCGNLSPPDHPTVLRAIGHSAKQGAQSPSEVAMKKIRASLHLPQWSSLFLTVCEIAALSKDITRML